jgi:hypothetical protein
MQFQENLSSAIPMTLELLQSATLMSTVFNGNFWRYELTDIVQATGACEVQATG